MFAAIHCNYCPSIWPPKAMQQHAGPSSIMHIFPRKAQRWKLLLFTSKQCINSYKTGFKTAMHKMSSVFHSPAHILKMTMCEWRKILLQSFKLVLLQTDWIKTQESIPNLQFNSRDKKPGKMGQTSLFKVTLQCTKANFSLAKLSKILICRSSSSCYLVWEISGIRTKFSHSKNETQQGDWCNCWDRGQNLCLYSLHLLVQLIDRRHQGLQGTK